MEVNYITTMTVQYFGTLSTFYLILANSILPATSNEPIIIPSFGPNLWITLPDTIPEINSICVDIYCFG